MNKTVNKCFFLLLLSEEEKKSDIISDIITKIHIEYCNADVIL